MASRAANTAIKNMDGMAATEAATNFFGTVTLFSGSENLLVERKVEQLCQLLKNQQPQLQINDVAASDLDGSALPLLLGSSLFAENVVTIIRDLSSLPANLVDVLLNLSQKIPAEVALIITHNGGQKGSATFTKLKKIGAQVISCPAPKAWELDKFIFSEARRLGVKIEPQAAQLLLTALGADLLTLSAAVLQLCADSASGTISVQLANTYYGGRAGVTSYAVADALLDANLCEAISRLRWALQNGVAAVMITSALAGNLRIMGKYLSYKNTCPNSAELAKAVGCPVWKLKDISRAAKNWDTRKIALGICALAEADIALKGGAAAPDFVLEQLLLQLLQ